MHRDVYCTNADAVAGGQFRAWCGLLLAGKCFLQELKQLGLSALSVLLVQPVHGRIEQSESPMTFKHSLGCDRLDQFHFVSRFDGFGVERNGNPSATPFLAPFAMPFVDQKML